MIDGVAGKVLADVENSSVETGLIVADNDLFTEVVSIVQRGEGSNIRASAEANGRLTGPYIEVAGYRNTYESQQALQVGDSCGNIVSQAMPVQVIKRQLQAL